MLETARVGWPAVKSSEDILPWAIHEFSAKAIDYEIFAWLEQEPSPDPDDRDLMMRCRPYVEQFNEGFWFDHLRHLTGKADKSWTTKDFAVKPVRRTSRRDQDPEEEEAEIPSDPAQLNLQLLTDEFLGWVHREEGVPLTKGNLGKDSLYTYLVRRLLGKLDGDDLPGRGPPRPTPGNIHPLCPDGHTLERYLAGMFSVFDNQYYKVAATLEMVPAWLRFLQTRQLVSAEQAALSLQTLDALHNKVLTLFETYKEDPVLARCLRSWDRAL